MATTRRVKKQYPEPIKVWKVVRGDKVEVITGKEKGKRGTILKVPHTSYHNNVQEYEQPNILSTHNGKKQAFSSRSAAF